MFRQIGARAVLLGLSLRTATVQVSRLDGSKNNSKSNSGSTDNNTVKVKVPDSILTDEAYLNDKQSCSFCKHFLGSPCKTEFLYWSKCVDMAKEQGLDYVAACDEYTGALLECTREHSEHFASPDPEEDADSSDDNDEMNTHKSNRDQQDDSVSSASHSSNSSHQK